MLKRTVPIIIGYLKKLNVYVLTNEDTVEKRQEQILATRFFIVLFISSLIGLVGYASLSLQLSIVYIENPTQSIFEELQSLYPDTLSCPCSQSSIQFSKFVHVNVSYHQICSSIFVSDKWISSIANEIPQLLYLLDIRLMISSELQLIASQCISSEVAVKDALKTLGSNQLFVTTMLSRNTLESQVDIIVGEIKKNAIAEQTQSRGLIQTMNQQNQLASALGSNFMYSLRNNNESMQYLVKFLANWTYPPQIGYAGYSDSQLCFCIDSSSCIYPSGIYSTLTGSHSYSYGGLIIPPVISSTQITGLYVGCMPFDAIMESTLECFYSNVCLSLLFNRTNIKPLDNTINSNYSIDTKVRVLIENLFVEDWSSEKDFESFFKECQPDKCSYSYNAKGNVAFIITTILSLIGGLFTALKIIASLLVDVFKKLEKKIKKLFCKTSLDNKDKPNISNETRSSKKNMFNNARQWIVNFNLFKHPYNDAHGRRNEILATRLYILLMTGGVIVIVFYALIVEHTLTYSVESPLLDNYRELVDKYPSLSCECEQITIAYSIFISLSPTFHQACSSIFVSDLYVPRYQDSNKPYKLGTVNLRISTPSYAASGRTVCTLIKDTSHRAIDTFLQTIYISNYLTHENEFQTRMQAFVNNFQVLSPITINHLLKLTQYTTQGNQLLTGTFSNAKLNYNLSSITKENQIDILAINPYMPSCSCGMSSNSCAILYNDYCKLTSKDTAETTCWVSIPGLTISCSIVDGLLISTLEYFYDENTTRTSIWVLTGNPNNTNNTINLPNLTSIILDKNAPSRFHVNSTIFDILSELGIEDWNENIDYSSYYDSCKPMNCFYTITKHFHIPTIATTVIGLIGGLSVILRIVIPSIIKLIRRAQINHTIIPWQEPWFHRLRNNFRELNFFKTAETDQSIEIRHDQIISTRLYIILWIISVLILSLYSGLTKKTILVHVDSPSISVVKQFQLQNLNDFVCPCSKITVSFEKFTSLNFTFHQICSSDFVSNKWLTALFNFDNDLSVSRGVLSSYFQLLHYLCQLSNETLFDAREIFYTNQFISVDLLTQNQFNNQTQAVIDEFQTKTINSFRRNLGLIVDITLGNQLISVYETNWHIIFDPQGSAGIYTKSRSYDGGNCSCSSSESLDCVGPLVIGKNTSIPGMLIGCLPITSLRLSTLQCFYDQNCLDQVKNILNIQNISIIPLNTTQSSQFPMNITFNQVIDNLMLEKWPYDVDYDKYFNECSPQQCSYSIVKENNPLVIFTTLLGLYGGLTVILNFIAPTIVKIGRKIYNKCQSTKRIVPQ